MGEEVLSIRLDDEGTPQTAAQSADALDYLLKVIDRFGKTDADLGMPVRVLERLGVTGKQAGSALAAGMSGTLDATMRAVSGVTKLSSVLELATKRAAALKREEDKAFDAAVKAANKTPAHLQVGQEKGTVSTFAAVTGLVGKIFGPGAAQGLVSGAGKLAEASDKMAPWMPLLEKGGGALFAGGKMIGIGALAVTAAAAALVAGAAVVAGKLLYAGAELAIKSTTFRENTENALEAVLKNAKEARATYEAGVKVAVELGLEKEDTLARIKSLVTSGFRGEDVTVIVRAVADFREAKGDEAGNALQKNLEKIKAKGLFNQEALNGLAEAGLQTDLVLAKLSQKLGISIDLVKGKLKTGQIDVATGIKAILDAANEQTGGAAEKASKSLPKLAESARTLFESLFDKVDTSPLKDALNSIKKLLSGPEGDALRGAANQLFGTMFKIVGKAFSGPEGEERLKRFITGITKIMEGAAAVLESAGPRIISVIDGISKIVDRNGSSTGGSWLESLVMGIAELSDGLAGTDIAGALKSLFSVFDSLQPYVDKMFALGSQLIAGLINGMIAGGDPGSILTGIVARAIAGAAGPKGADAHSPSRKTGAIGGWMGEGLVTHVLAWRDRAESAGASLADRAVAGMGRTANDNATVSPIAAAPSAGSGVSPTVIVQIQMGASSATGADLQAVKAAAEEGAYLGLQKGLVRFARGELRRTGS